MVTHEMMLDYMPSVGDYYVRDSADPKWMLMTEDQMKNIDKTIGPQP